MIYLNPVRGRSSVTHANVIMPRVIYEGHMEVEYEMALAHLLIYTITQYKIFTSTRTPTHSLYCMHKVYVYIRYCKSNTIQNLTNKLSEEAACVGFCSEKVLYKWSAYREKALNYSRIRNFKSIRHVRITDKLSNISGWRLNQLTGVRFSFTGSFTQFYAWLKLMACFLDITSINQLINYLIHKESCSVHVQDDIFKLLFFFFYPNRTKSDVIRANHVGPTTSLFLSTMGSV